MLVHTPQTKLVSHHSLVNLRFIDSKIYFLDFTLLELI